MSKTTKRLKPSPVAERIRNRMRVLRISQADLARRANVSPVFLSELLRGAKQSLKYDTLLAFASALEINPNHLAGSGFPARIPRPKIPDAPRILSKEEAEDYEFTAERERLEESEDPMSGMLPALFRRQKYVSFRPAGSIEAPVPVYGEEVGHLFAIDALATGAIARPPLLHWTDGAYAVIAGGGMSPRYNSGEILFVAPGTAVRDGDYVVVVTRSETGRELAGRVCRLKSVTHTQVLIETLSPQKTETIPLNMVSHIHRIVLAGEAILDQ